MSLSRGRRRATINGATLSRAQTITFERQIKQGDCFIAGDGKMRCKNENKGVIFNRSKNIEPSKAKPTKEDTLKSIQEIEPKCFILSDGTKKCLDDNGKSIDVSGGKKKPLLSIATFKGNVKEMILGTGKDIKKGATVAFKFKDKAINFILTNENRARAAKVIADAVSLGLIAVGSIVVAASAPIVAGVVGGAVIGGALIAGGGALGAASIAGGKALDATILAAKKIKQLENAIEVARIALKTKVNRDDLIEKNKEAIENREEELLEMSKLTLKTRASELNISNISSLKKVDLAREVAIQEIIGNAGKEEVEPSVGKSLLETNVKKEKDRLKKEREEKELQEKKELQDKKDILKKINEEFIVIQEQQEEEKEDTPPPPLPSNIDTTGANQQKPKDFLNDQLEAAMKTPKVILNPTRVLGDDEDLPVAPTDTIGLDISESEVVEDQSPSEFLAEQVVEPRETFQFTQITNRELINNPQASRRKLEAAMKTDLLTKPKNFNNPKKLTEEQKRGASGNGGLDKQKAAVINNNDENIYNQIIRELTNADDCRAYLTANIAKIAILPPGLKDELRNYCDNIMNDDESF